MFRAKDGYFPELHLQQVIQGGSQQSETIAVQRKWQNKIATLLIHSLQNRNKTRDCVKVNCDLTVVVSWSCYDGKRKRALERLNENFHSEQLEG